jgi:hypothetical protein
MWLAHHPPDDYGRCVLVGRSYVCRRCVVLYPITFAALALALVRPLPGGLGEVVFVVLPLPAVLELVAEQLGLVEGRPGRQVAVTVPLAIGLGVGLAGYLDDHGDLLFWAVVVLYTSVCAAAVSWRHRRASSA